MIKMGIIIKASVKAPKAIVSSQVIRDMQYWGQRNGSVVIDGQDVTYKSLRRVAENGLVNRMIIVEASA